MKILKGLIVTFVLGFLFIAAVRVASAEEAIIYIQPSFKEVALEEEFTVDLIIKGDKPVVGADVKIDYDDKIIKILSIEDGDAFDQLPIKSAKDGKIRITGISEKEVGFTGTAKFASLKVKAIDAGDTKLTIEFAPGVTTDTNLTTKEAKDILVKVDSGRFIIGTAIQRSTALARRSFISMLPYIIFLIIILVLVVIAYFFWRRHKKKIKEVFIPQKVPMDRPPTL